MFQAFARWLAEKLVPCPHAYEVIDDQTCDGQTGTLRVLTQLCCICGDMRTRRIKSPDYSKACSHTYWVRITGENLYMGERHCGQYEAFRCWREADNTGCGATQHRYLVDGVPDLITIEERNGQVEVINPSRYPADTPWGVGKPRIDASYIDTGLPSEASLVNVPWGYTPPAKNE